MLNKKQEMKVEIMRGREQEAGDESGNHER